MTDISFKQVADDYLNFITNRDRRQATLATYRSNLNQLIVAVPSLATTPLDDASVEKFITIKRRDEASPASINQSLRFMRAVIRFGAKRNLCSDKIEFVFLKTPKRHKMITEDLLKKALDVAKSQDERLYHVIKFAAFTGCRNNELLTRCWSDVDFEAGTLLVGARGEFQTKSGDDRVLPLTKAAVDWLREHKATQRLNEGSDPILQQAEGKAWTSRIFRLIAKVFKDAGIPDIRLHGLRHLFVTTLLERGAPIHSVQALAGHKSLATTMNHYAHSRQKALRDAVNLLNE